MAGSKTSKRKYDDDGSSDAEDVPIAQKSTPKKVKKAKDVADEEPRASKPASSKAAKKLAKSTTPAKSKPQPKPADDDDDKDDDDGDDSAEDEPGPVVVHTSTEGEKYVDLGKKKRATVRTFKGNLMIDIREFYGNEGDEKPGKKGISLQLDQWEALKKAVPAVDRAIKKLK